MDVLQVIAQSGICGMQFWEEKENAGRRNKPKAEMKTTKQAKKVPIGHQNGWLSTRTDLCHITVPASYDLGLA